MRIDKATFTALFADVEANREQIRATLMELAGKVARRLPRCSHDWEDLAHSIWLHCDAQTRNFDPAKGNAYSYFYRIAQRHGMRIIRDTEVLHSLPSQCESSRMPRQLTPLSSRVADERKPTTEIRHSLKLLDRIIRKIKESIANVEPDSRRYHYLASGLDFLEQYRFSLCGSYHPAKIPTAHYSKYRIVTRVEATN
jgi:DNA-directed RNA polymerase specialized sigma24 family protein